MNSFDLETTLFEHCFYMSALTRNLGEPVSLSREVYQMVLSKFRLDNTMSQKFMVVIDVKKQAIIKYFNTEKFIVCERESPVQELFRIIHPHFLPDFLKWVKHNYVFVFQYKHKVKPINQCLKLTIPLKLGGNRYYWVLQEVIPLSVDKDHNLVWHLNIYTVLRPIEETEEVEFQRKLKVLCFNLN